MLGVDVTISTNDVGEGLHAPFETHTKLSLHQAFRELFLKLRGTDDAFDCEGGYERKDPDGPNGGVQGPSLFLGGPGPAGHGGRPGNL